MDISKYDQKIQNLITMILKNLSVNQKAAMEDSEKLIAEGVRTKNNELQALGYYYISAICYSRNDGAGLFDSITSTISFLNNTDNYDLLAQSYNLMGVASFNRGSVALALDYYLRAENYAKRSGRKNLQAIIEANVGALYCYCRKYQKALDTMAEVESSMGLPSEKQQFGDVMICVYQNMAKAHLMSGNPQACREYLDKIQKDYQNVMTAEDILSSLCIETAYYNITGDDENFEKNVEKISSATDQSIVIMNLFEEIYDYTKILLQRDKKEEFKKMVRILEPMLKSLDLANLLLRVLSLKIQYFRKYGMKKEYSRATSQYYDLTQRAVKENNVVTNSIINLQKNIETLQQQNEILIEKSEIDPLTKIANRLRLNEYSEKLFQKALKEKKSLTVEILDVDNFKGYNDGFGHQAGDECLVEIAQVLKTMEKEHNAFAARYGGDEFIVIYVGISREQAANYAEELRQKVIALNMPQKDANPYPVVTVSQGLCWEKPIPMNKVWDYLHAADNALYMVKQKNRNNYCISDFKANKQFLVEGKYLDLQAES